MLSDRAAVAGDLLFPVGAAVAAGGFFRQARAGVTIATGERCPAGHRAAAQSFNARILAPALVAAAHPIVGAGHGI